MENKDIYKKTLNNLIAADDLHWNDEEGKYVALSNGEIDQIIMNCLESNFYEEEFIMKIINWATHIKVGQILFNNFIKKQIKIVGLDENDEPYFDIK
jgi:hypothetical protein